MELLIIHKIMYIKGKREKALFPFSKIRNYYGGDHMQRQILHIDVNNAFLSWTAVEMLKQGYELDIRTIPAIIRRR